MFSKRRYRRRNKPSLSDKSQLKQDTPFVPPVQTKLNVGKPGDAYEIEADRTADKVVAQTGGSEMVQKMGGEEEEIQAKAIDTSSLTPFVQRVEDEESVQSKGEEEEQVQMMEEEESVQSMEEEEQVQSKCSECGKEHVQKQEEEEVQSKEAENEEPIQTKCADCERENAQRKEDEEVQAKSEIGTGASPNIAAALRSERGGGSPMDKTTKSEMEGAFGSDFSSVKIHTDQKANSLSRQLNARAFTNGRDIYFNRNEYSPRSREGKHLLAHELTHTIQQKGRSNLVQRAVTVNPAPKTSRDIDLFDASTWPNGDSLPVGETKTLVNGLEIKRVLKEEGEEALKNLLFPIPTYKSGITSCHSISKNINVALSHEVRTISNLPQKRTIASSDLASIVQGLFGSSKCNSTTVNQIDAIVSGHPNDQAFGMLVDNAEQQHVDIDYALIDQFIKSYEQDVANLPSEMGSTFTFCDSIITQTLQRNEYWHAFWRRWNAFNKKLDEKGGLHHLQLSVIDDPNCSSVTLLLRFKAGKFHLPGNAMWKPPKK